MAKENLLNKFANASGKVVKSFLGVNTEVISANNYRSSGSTAGNSGWLFDTPSPGIDVFFSYSGLADVQRAYECCSPVFTIVNKQAYAFQNGKTRVVDQEGKEAKGKWADKVNVLLKRPNPIQNWKQFEAQIAIYIRLFGYCIILPAGKPVGYGNEDAEAFWIIPPFMCEFDYNKTSFFNLKEGFIKSVMIKYGNEETVLQAENLIILKDVTPNFDNVYLPGSPIKPLKENINNLMAIYNSKGMLINYRGALGILSPEIDPNGAVGVAPDEDDKENWQDELNRYGLKRGQWKFIVATSSMKWQQMGIPYKDLMLTEWAEDESKIICDVLNYPFKLLANTQSSSLNGGEIDSFKKQLYVDFVLPFSEMIYEQFTEALNGPKNGCFIVKDFSHVAVLQEDDLKKAQARNTRNQALQLEFNNNMITLNRWLELNKEPPMTGDEGNKYYRELIADGWVFGKGAPAISITSDSNTETPKA